MAAHLPSIWSLFSAVDPVLAEDSRHQRWPAEQCRPPPPQSVAEQLHKLSASDICRKNPESHATNKSFHQHGPNRVENVFGVPGDGVMVDGHMKGYHNIVPDPAASPPHHVEAPINALQPSETSPSYDIFVCPLTGCDKTFACESDRQKHVTISHHIKGKQFPCPHLGCRSSFRNNCELTNHLRVHAGFRDFKCPACPKAFGHKSHLTRHFRLHTGERPFVCREAGCRKSFTRSDELRSHSRNHTRERPYVCAECHEGFMQRIALRRHLRKHQ